MTTRSNPARREPLLWLQLLGLAVLPLETALLLLVLAGADPGPLPGLERLFTWALGALGPAALFWRLPPDLWSLLVLQVPLKGRRPDQLRLSALQGALPLKLLAASGVLPLLPLLWWADGAAGLAWAWSPLASSPRLVVLLVAVPLLAVMLWQWQQLVQALWMFSRSPSAVEQTLPLSFNQAAEHRLNLGLPLLLLPPLEISAVPPASTSTSPSPSPNPNAEEVQQPQQPEPPQEPPQPTEPPEVPEVPEPEGGSVAPGAIAAISDVPVTPEQGAEQGEGSDLDHQV